MNRCADLVHGSEICGDVSAERMLEGGEIVLFPRSRPVGVKTESTAEEGGVQPGGGRVLDAAHADTTYHMLVRHIDACVFVKDGDVVTHVMLVLHRP